MSEEILDDENQAPEVILPHDRFYTHMIGEPVVVVSDSEQPKWSLVFEDDGETGYLYAIDNEAEDGNAVLDAALIYQRLEPRETQMFYVWANANRGALVMDGSVQAVVDFEAHRFWTHTNFPEPSEWTKGDKAWDDSAMDGFGTEA